MKAFNLITADEKKLMASDKQKFTSLILAEYNTKTGEFSERGNQLKDFRQYYIDNSKLARIRLKVKAMNLYRQYQMKAAEKLISEDLVGEKVYKMDGGFTKKHENHFKLENTIVSSPGEKAGHRTHEYVTRSYRSIDVSISVNVWENGERGEYKSSFRIFELENDKMVIKETVTPEIAPQVDLNFELKKAEKYLRYKKEVEEKLSALKSECNYTALETIESENLFFGKF